MLPRIIKIILFVCNPTENKTHPVKISDANNKVIIWSPYKSMNSPDIRGIIIFGKLYIE